MFDNRIWRNLNDLMKNFFIRFIAVLLSLFINYENAISATINIDDSSSTDNKLAKINKSDDNNKVKSNKSAEDLFGDEQTFPFVAGLGKNAAH